MKDRRDGFLGAKADKKMVLGKDEKGGSWVDGTLSWKDGREEGTLRDALFFEFARAQILLEDLRFQA